MNDASAFEFGPYGWRLAITMMFVLLNAFFVAAEFALVKVSGARLELLAQGGARSARVACHIHGNLGHYLSACQLGITLASLILGWLAEPAIAELLLAGLVAAGWELAPNDPVLHGVALAIALTVVTVLHMVLGEQAPKIWAINRSDSTALAVALPLRAFGAALWPLIWSIDRLSSGVLRLVGMGSDEISEPTSHNAQEIKKIIAASAAAGHLSARQHELAENVIDLMTLEVRHILVPRVDVVFLSLERPLAENLARIRESGHSRFPLCQVGLDSVVGIVHAKAVLNLLADGQEPDLRVLARPAVFASDTQPLSRLILQLQRAQNHACVVLDERGTSIGLAFLEDALEELVGPIYDEFDEAPPGVKRLDNGQLELPGSMALPEAADELGVSEELGEESDTIGGHVVAQLGRLPRRGDRVVIGDWEVAVLSVSRRRIERLRCSPREA